MTALELLRYQLDDGTFQLNACLAPLPEEHYDLKVTPEGMSAREMAVHLCECAEALLAHVEGRPFRWGEFRLDDTSKSGLLAAWQDARARAVTAALADDRYAREAHAYLVAHDAYHVGQLCLIHLATNPGFNPYSIYREAG